MIVVQPGTFAGGVLAGIRVKREGVCNDMAFD